MKVSNKQSGTNSDLVATSASLFENPHFAADNSGSVSLSNTTGSGAGQGGLSRSNIALQVLFTICA